MLRLLTFGTLLALTVAAPSAEPPPAKILLIGHKRDHPRLSHEYLAVAELLAKCLRQSPGITAITSDGWPKDETLLADVSAIVLYSSPGGNLLLDRGHRRQAEELLKRGVGLTAIHWSTASEGADVGEAYLPILGGRFSTTFSGLRVDHAELRQQAPPHPIHRGWRDFKLRDEYYLKLKFMPEVVPLVVAEISARTEQRTKPDTKEKFTVTIPEEKQLVAWAYERPDSRGGRSFGCSCGHFHDNFGIEAFRRLLVNGILWTAHRDIPLTGAPVEMGTDDLAVPPDTPEHRLPRK
jgi:type 1 glutamine amidotransferase